MARLLPFCNMRSGPRSRRAESHSLRGLERASPQNQAVEPDLGFPVWYLSRSHIVRTTLINVYLTPTIGAVSFVAMNSASYAVSRPLSLRISSLALSAQRPVIRSARLSPAIMASEPPTWTRLYSQPAAPQQEKDSTKKPIPEPRPSSSIVLLSPTNEVLLLHRVKTSTSFASAHVFPGGNLDAFHDGDIPAPGTHERHRDGPAYRLGAVRECFEETGILLAKKDGRLVDLPQQERDEARKKIHGSQIKFAGWLKSIGAEADQGLF